MSIDIRNIRPQQQPAPKNDLPPAKNSSWWDWLNRDISLSSNAWNAKKKVTFYDAMHTLLSSGLDIQNALQLAVYNFNKPKDKNLVEQIRQTMLQGAALSEALEKTGYFSVYEVFSVKIGEESGKLLEVLEQLSSFFNKSLRYQRQLTSALAYPVFVLGFSGLAVFFLLRYLVPMFSGIYGRFGQELPALTRTIVYLSELMGLYTPLAMACLLGLIGTIYWQRKQLWWRKTSAWLLLHIPVIGKIVHNVYLARFCESMFLLLSARVPLLQAVQLVSQMMQFYPVEQALVASEKQILQGTSLQDALSQHAFFPPTMLALIRVGEESGKLDFMFKRLSENLHNDIDHQTALLGSLLEPILIIFLGVLVAVVLVAMYLPLFQMGTSFGG